MAKQLVHESSWCKVEVDDKTGERFITTFDAKPAKAEKAPKKEEKKDEE